MNGSGPGAAAKLDVIFPLLRSVFRVARLFDHVDHGIIQFTVRFAIVGQRLLRTRLLHRTGAHIFDSVLGALLQLPHAAAGLLDALLVGRTVEHAVLLFFLRLQLRRTKSVLESDLFVREC